MRANNCICLSNAERGWECTLKRNMATSVKFCNESHCSDQLLQLIAAHWIVERRWIHWCIYYVYCNYTCSDNCKLLCTYQEKVNYCAVLYVMRLFLPVPACFFWRHHKYTLLDWKKIIIIPGDSVIIFRRNLNRPLPQYFYWILWCLLRPIKDEYFNK